MFSGHCNHFLHILHEPHFVLEIFVFVFLVKDYANDIDIFFSYFFQDDSAFHGFTEEKITFFRQKADEKTTMFQELIDEVEVCK